MRTRFVLLLAASAGALALSACYASDATVRSDVPPRDDFSPVADVLAVHCGSLDCHGDTGRNLRIYGQNGMRLEAGTLPDHDPTTELERDATYAAVVGLEPEVLARVYADGGARPERLTLVRKARGAEHHAGGAPFEAGDDADRCFTSWLEGRLDAAACARAAELERPAP